MLSPSMIANSYGNTERARHIIAAVSICARSPVPLSPITSSFTESLPTGGSASSAGAAGA